MERSKQAHIWFDFIKQLGQINCWADDALKVFNLINKYRPEDIIPEIISGIPTVVFIHSTKGGTAVGGTRSWPYSSVAVFLLDGLRLSSGMTYKTIWSRLPPAGGKAVIYGTGQEVLADEFCQGYASLLNKINSSGEVFTTGEDIGCGEEFVDKVAKYTPYIVGKSQVAGGLGDPSPHTAEGTFLAIKAMVENTDIFDGKLQDKICASQGAGKVALPVIEMLLKAGAKVYFSENDGNPAAEEKAREAKALGAIRMAKNDIYQVPCHIFMPFALGGVMNKQTIPMLSSACKMVAGAANNILDASEDGVLLHQRGIYFAPDYVINRWGLEWVMQEKNGINDPLEARQNLSDIASDVLNIFTLSKEKNLASSEIAETIASRVLNEEASSIEEALEQLR